MVKVTQVTPEGYTVVLELDECRFYENMMLLEDDFPDSQFYWEDASDCEMDMDNIYMQEIG